jgi:peptidoglycan-associated lipoprotein
MDAGQFNTVSYGKERPTCDEHNEACWGKNRRGVLVLQ